jgi:iron-sulfur cluster assembly protein
MTVGLKPQSPLAVYFSSILDSTMSDEKVLVITENAMKQLKLSEQQGKCLRIGVKSGGCSGLSYTMDFVKEDSLKDSDHIEYIGDMKCLIDPKSLLLIYGLQLDYSAELIGGGFKFINPNAKR